MDETQNETYWCVQHKVYVTTPAEAIEHLTCTLSATPGEPE